MAEQKKKAPTYKIQKPFLKWVGGKTQLLDKISEKFPLEMNNYHEIFLGGGSILFALLSLKEHGELVIKGKVYAYDINECLINVYKHVQKDKDELYGLLRKYVEEYDNLKGAEVNRTPQNKEEAMTSKESYYYWVRSKYNKMDNNSVEKSALFIFINKTCFRGMYREGPNGYNVPYGNYKKTPGVVTKEELDKISLLIKDVEFIHCDFAASLDNVDDGDFVYLDPPYAPENDKSFVGYVSDGFNLDKHKQLFGKINEIKNKAKIIMSNAKVKLVTDAFEDYNIDVVKARRAINSKNPGKGTEEVIIYN